MSIILRKPEKKDLEWLCEEFKIFSKYYNTKKSLYHSDEYTKDLILNISKNHIFTLAEDTEKGLMGWIVALAAPHLFNPDIKTTTLVSWWVSEEHRKSRVGYLLLKNLIKIAKENSDWFIVTVNVDSPVKKESLKNLGFSLVENQYLMEV